MENSNLNATVPIGTIVMYGGIPASNNIDHLEKSGWKLCHGQELKASTYPKLFACIDYSFGGSRDKKVFRLPDCRGMFIRGVDAGKGVDPNANDRKALWEGEDGNTGDRVGSKQGDMVEAHEHDIYFGLTKKKYAENGKAVPFGLGNKKWEEQPAPTDTYGGAETRPVNLYLNFIIKCT